MPAEPNFTNLSQDIDYLDVVSSKLRASKDSTTLAIELIQNEDSAGERCSLV